MSKIFYSYRPTDRAIGERIVERLISNYGREEIGHDIRPDARRIQDLRSYLEDFLKPIAVFVVVIGPTWLVARGGAHRLEDPQDVVRVELAVALSHAIPVIPVIVRGAGMPRADDLPDELKTLAEQELLRFESDDTFRGDMMRLHHRLAKAIAEHERPQVAPEQRTDTPPNQARKDQLQELARIREEAGKPPFQGVRIQSLGEVFWILGAQRGELGSKYGERRFAPNLSGADLSGLNLKDADLRGARLASANLARAELSGANLTEAFLSDADLTDASLAGAKLSRAVMTGATVQLANLGDADLQGADLSSLDLRTTTLTGSNMEDVILHGATLAEVELPDVKLNRADLTGTNLRNAALQRGQFEEAQFARAQLDGADMSESRLVKADLSGASLQRTDLSGSDLSEATIGSVDEMEHVIIDSQTRFDKVNWGGKPIKDPRRLHDRDQRLRAYRETAQIYRDIAEMLTDAGFVAEASSYRLLQQRMVRGLLFDTRHYGEWLFSTLLNAICGYGERISRTLVTYIVIVLGFAVVYFVGSNYLHMDSAHLSAGGALIESLVSFHGRGFVSAALQLSDQMAGVTMVEAVCGLFVEIIFIASFSRRFLGF